MVNGKKTDIPSFICKPGDVITVRPEHINERVLQDGRWPASAAKTFPPG